MSEKTQIIFIHGGNSFDTDEEFYEDLRNREFDLDEQPRIRWRDTLAKNLSSTHTYHFILMPNAMNADYRAWSIWFDKVVPFLQNDVIFIGHSLGGSFLLQYLSENILSVSAAQLHLVAPGVDTIDCPGMGNFSTELSSWTGFKNVIKAIHIWHSKDDELVPIHHSERLHKKLPSAIFHRFTDRGHFQVPEFPEIEAVILEK